MTARRFPRGYLGLDHETRGSELLAILECVHVPEQTLGPEMTRKLRAVKPDLWYPIADMLDLLDRLDQKLGAFHLKQVGWTLFSRYQAEIVKKLFDNAYDVLRNSDEQYRRNNRGHNIGGWKVVSFGPGKAELEKTTPHHCVMEEGIFEEMMRTIGVPVKVHQAECFRQGAPCCRFVIETKINDARWQKLQVSGG